MRTPAFSITANKGADQLRGNRAADQRLCYSFLETATLYFLNPKFLGPGHLLLLYSPVLCLTWSDTRRQAKWFIHLNRVMRKPTFYICENKDADQLRGDREADQRLCFRYTDSTITLLSKSEISSL